MTDWTDFYTFLKYERNFFLLFFAVIYRTVGEVTGKGRERNK